MFTSTLNLIPITSRLAKVSGSRKLKPTVLTANHNQDTKKALRQGGAFLFLEIVIPHCQVTTLNALAAHSGYRP